MGVLEVPGPGPFMGLSLYPGSEAVLLVQLPANLFVAVVHNEHKDLVHKD